MSEPTTRGRKPKLRTGPVGTYRVNCRTHGGRYPLADNSAMCAHPNCLKGTVQLFTVRSVPLRRAWSYLVGRGLWEDAVQYLVLRFTQQRARGMTPVFTPTWVGWELSHFGQAPARDPKQETTYHQPQGSETPLSWPEAVREHFSQPDDGYSPYYGALIAEVQSYLIENGQTNELMYLRQDITLAELWVVQMNTQDEATTYEDTLHATQFTQAWVARWAANQLGHDLTCDETQARGSNG